MTKQDATSLNASLVDKSMFVFCPTCGERQQVEFGEWIHDVTRAQAIEAATNLGWRMAPKIQCPNCISRAKRNTSGFMVGCRPNAPMK